MINMNFETKDTSQNSFTQTHSNLVIIDSYFRFQDVNIRIMFYIRFFEGVGWLELIFGQMVC